jgi:hypothetical protein
MIGAGHANVALTGVGACIIIHAVGVIARLTGIEHAIAAEHSAATSVTNATRTIGSLFACHTDVTAANIGDALRICDT